MGLCNLTSIKMQVINYYITTTFGFNFVLVLTDYSITDRYKTYIKFPLM